MTDLLSLLAGNTIVAFILAAIALIATRAGRPALAHVAWLLVLVKLVTPPVWSVPIGSFGSNSAAPPSALSTAQSPSMTDAARSSPSEAVRGAADETVAEQISLSPIPISPAGAPLSMQFLVLSMWSVGAVGVLAVSIARCVRFRRLLQSGVPAASALHAEVAALSERVGLRLVPETIVVPRSISPMLWFVGTGAPRLILPESLFQTLSPVQRADVIVHELAHLRRRDHWVRLLEWPLTVLLWFHPLVWLARRGLRDAEEACCDAWVLSLREGERRGYADTLLKVLESVHRGHTLPPGSTGFGRLHRLKRRLEMIVTQSPPRTLSPLGRCVVLSMAVAALFVPVRGIAQATQATQAPVAVAADAIRVAAGESVQKVIDAAPSGATIVLEAAAYDESITITKPLTLIGAGWQQTIIGHTQPAGRTQKEKDDFFKRLDAAATNEERTRLAQEVANYTEAPTLAVRDTSDVTIRNLRIRGPRVESSGRMLPGGSLVVFDRVTSTTLNDVAIVGPSSSGISVQNGADVSITRCLVAGMWNTGIQIARAKAHVSESDIRNCYSRCVTIAGEGSIIERNRISGSAWHGIRYDNCSPTVRDNLIFGNARSGIYASGKTAATVSGNVFWRNEMDGISCWTANTDDISGNTFINNVREAIAVLGGSTTKLSRNIFVGSPIAIEIGAVGGEAGVIGSPTLSGNVFWNNTLDFATYQAKESLPLSVGNERVDPKLFAVEKADFSTSLDSPARKLNAGATNAASLADAYAITNEERSMVPDGDTRDYQKWKTAAAGP